MTCPPRSGNTSAPRRFHCKRTKNTLPFLLGLSLLVPTLITLLLCLSSLPILSNISLKIYDCYLCSAPTETTTGIPLIVDIDEKALKKYGQWPWPRFRVADLLEKINQGGPLAVGLDIIFSEPDGTSLAEVYADIRQHFGITLQNEGIPETLWNNDILLSNTLALGKFVLSLHFTFTEGPPDDRCILHPLKITTRFAEGAEGDKISFVSANSVLCNLPIFSNSTKMNGFLNIRPDADGILRRAPLLIEYQGKLYPNLSLATLITALNPTTQLLKISRFGVQGLTLDDLFIPLDNNGYFTINFRGPAKTFEYISAVDMLDSNVPPETLKDRIIFVGTSAAGLKDTHQIPFDSVFPGVELHANIVDNILSGNFLQQPSWAKETEAAIIILTGLGSAFLFFKFGAGRGLLTFILSGTGLFWGGKTLLVSNGIFISPLYPTLSLMFNFFLIYAVKFYQSEQLRRKRKQELALMLEAMLETITLLTEARDQETGGHIRRTQNYMKIMAEELRTIKKYKKILSDEEIEVLYKVAPLHDVGKIAVPDNILLKPGPLNKEEFKEIKKHTYYGKQIIERALKRVGKNYFLEKAMEIAYTHQEKWDGSGYPQGLSGEEIPLSGRIMAVSDVYDALTSKRPYKNAVRHEKAVAIMRGDSGTYFDPDLIEIFVRVHERFRIIAMQYAESEQERNLLSKKGEGKTKLPSTGF